MKRSSFFVAVGAILILTGQGCTGSNPATGPDGGVFKTKNAESVWTQLKALQSGTKVGSIANVGTVSGAVDPQDPSTLYVGTTENGVLYTLDGGESWQLAKGMSVGRIAAIAVDPKDKCTVYATRSNQVFKTETCSRDWNQVYFDPRTDKRFTTLIVDWYNPKTVYAGTSDGDIVRSTDGGASWRVVHRVDGVSITMLTMDPRDSRTVYAATNGSGIGKTTDGGQTWTMIRQPFQDFDFARRPVMVVVDPSLANTVYNVSKYGLLRSDDGGATWSALKLPTPPGTVDIRAFAIHPTDSRQLVYATDSSIVWSVDGGQTWTPKKLPTARGASFLLYDKAAEPSLFLGAAPPKQ